MAIAFGSTTFRAEVFHAAPLFDCATEVALRPAASLRYEAAVPGAFFPGHGSGSGFPGSERTQPAREKYKLERLLACAWRGGLLNDSATLDNPDQHDYYREYQQNVDRPGSGVSGR